MYGEQTTRGSIAERVMANKINEKIPRSRPLVKDGIMLWYKLGYHSSRKTRITPGFEQIYQYEYKCLKKCLRHIQMFWLTGLRHVFKCILFFISE